MSALLRAELLKLRTTRTFFALIGSGLALSLTLLVLVTLLADDFTKSDVRSTLAGDFTGIFILLLGAMGMAGEWRHRTITSTILAAPDRLKLLAAKTISYAIAGMVASFIVTACLMLVGTIILSSRGEPTLDVATLGDLMWRNLVVAAYLGALGVAVGAIVRQQVPVIVGLVLFPFVIGLTFSTLVPEIVTYSPLNGVPSGLTDTGSDGGDDDSLTAGVAALVMLGWVSVLFAAGAVLLRRRDLT